MDRKIIFFKRVIESSSFLGEKSQVEVLQFQTIDSTSPDIVLLQPDPLPLFSMQGIQWYVLKLGSICLLKSKFLLKTSPQVTHCPKA